jgi:arabinogalactan oligomer/maltooligosaccharide transport system permease protein
VISSLLQVFEFVALLVLFVAVLEVYLHIHFTYFDRGWFVPATVTGALVLAAVCGRELGTGRVLSLALAAAAVQAVAAMVFRHVIRGRHSLPIMLLAPGFIGLALLIAYPLAFEVYLAFHDLKLTTIMVWSRTGTIPFVGFKHFAKVFTSSPLSAITFWQLFGRTIWWTFINVFCHVIGGFILALLLNGCNRFRGLYRTFLVIPWAMPQVVAILALRGEFHSQYGFINIMLTRLVKTLPFLAGWGVGPVEWLSRHPLLTCTFINVWLGIPFMMVIILGGLQSISKHYYDAAAIDGASAWQQLRHITLPLLRPVLGPAITLGTVWTFNNINVIYLVTGQAGGSEDADILVSALYKAAFTFYRYSYSAALAIVIFLILFIFSLLWLKFSKSSESIYG